MPTKLQMQTQINEQTVFIEGLNQGAETLRQDNLELGRTISDLKAQLNHKVQANTDLKLNNDQLNMNINKAHEERNDMSHEVRLAEGAVRDLRQEIEDLANENGFEHSRRQALLTLMDNGLLLLYPYLSKRESGENAELLDPTERLLIEINSILEQDFSIHKA